MKVTNIIFCDDIRREINNKHTLVGCYSDRILITPRNGDMKWPVAVKLGIFITLIRESDDPKFNTFALEFFDSEESLAKVEGNLDGLDQGRPINIMFVLPLVFKRPGPLSGKFDFSEKDGVTITLKPELNFRLEIAKPAQQLNPTV